MISPNLAFSAGVSKANAASGPGPHAANSGGEGRRILIFHELPDNHLADASTATDSIRQNPKSQHHETQNIYQQICQCVCGSVSKQKSVCKHAHDHVHNSQTTAYTKVRKLLEKANHPPDEPKTMPNGWVMSLHFTFYVCR